MLIHQRGKHMAPAGAGGGESAGIRTWRVLYVQQWSRNLGEKTRPAWMFTLSDFSPYSTGFFGSRMCHSWVSDGRQMGVRSKNTTQKRRNPKSLHPTHSLEQFKITLPHRAYIATQVLSEGDLNFKAFIAFLF